jgi:hypothetical protein
MRIFAHAAILSLIGSGLTGAASAAEPTPIGDWRVKDGYANIRIDNCGGKLWGVVAWEKEPGFDKQNPDPAKKGRPILGMPILMAMAPAGYPQAAGLRSGRNLLRRRELDSGYKPAGQRRVVARAAEERRAGKGCAEGGRGAERYLRACRDQHGRPGQYRPEVGRMMRLGAQSGAKARAGRGCVGLLLRPTISPVTQCS